ncbi:MAG: hypothetical protein C0404_09985 [Verrucomicrobia bacterium]|nr:hypothetical protein [Verrucomicrobiota bacterium]
MSILTLVNSLKSRKHGAGVLILCTSLAVPFLPGALAAPADVAAPKPPEPAALYDTGTPSADQLGGDIIAQKAGWTKIEKAGPIKGDAVLTTAGLSVVARSKGAGIEIHGGDGKAWKLRSTLVPSGEGDWKIDGVKALQGDATSAGMEVTLAGKAGKVVLGLSVEAGKPIVKTKPVSGAEGLKMVGDSRFGILPDFFADDMVLDARTIPVDKTEVPGENFFMELLDEGSSIVTAVWDKSKRDPVLTLGGEKPARMIKNVELFYGEGGLIWIAVLEQKGIWATEEITADNVKKRTTLNWDVPFKAKWKGNFMRVDHTVDSWEFMHNPGSRGGWSGVVGSYEHPCWVVDNNGAKGMIEPPTKFPNGNFAGPFLVYPIDRVKETPLDKMTITDVMRNSLGIGPCEYIMDAAGQGVANRGIYTCSVEHTVPILFEYGWQKDERVYLNTMLREVQVFVKAIQDRINSYVDFREQTLKYLAEQKTAHADQAEFIGKLEEQTKRIQTNKANGIDPVSKMVAQIKPEIMGDVRRIDVGGTAAGIAGVGLGQDNAVAQCRQKVKILRQMATIEMALNPKSADVAKEMRKRTQQILRSPFGHEMR